MVLTHVQRCLGHLVCRGLGGIGHVFPDFCILHKLYLPCQGAGSRAHIGYLQQNPQILSLCTAERPKTIPPCTACIMSQLRGSWPSHGYTRLSPARHGSYYGLKAHQSSGIIILASACKSMGEGLQRCDQEAKISTDAAHQLLAPLPQQRQHCLRDHQWPDHIHFVDLKHILLSS